MTTATPAIPTNTDGARSGLSITPYEFPLFKEKSGCPTARYVGGTSRFLCECRNPYACPGVQAAAGEHYEGNMLKYMAWARSPHSPGGDRDWTEKYDARNGDFGDGALGLEMFMYNNLQRVILRHWFNATDAQSPANIAKIRAMIDEHRFTWMNEVRLQLAKR